MSTGNKSISVGFKVSGSELSSYIESIKKKSDELAQSSIRNALAQTATSKEQLQIINQQIEALDKKTRLETQAGRSILLEKRDRDLYENKLKYENQREEIGGNTKLTEKQRSDKLSQIDTLEKIGETGIKQGFRDNIASIKETEKQSKLQTQLAKEQIDIAKRYATEQINAIKNGDKTLADVYREVENDTSEDEKLTLKLIEDGLQKEKKKDERGSAGGGGSFFGSMLGVDSLGKLFTTVGQLTQTQNGFDLIQPASNIAGKIIGGVLGGAIGFLAGGAGALPGAAIGSQLGGAFGDTFGALEQREALSKEQFKKAALRYQAITGSDIDGMGMDDMANAGINFSQFTTARSDYARRRGYSAGSDTTTRDAFYAERGFGVDQTTSAVLAELQRSSKEGNRDLAGLISGIITKGQGNIFRNGDNTFLNEFLGRFASLQKELLKSSTTVASGTTMDILNRFNKVGGEFDIRDPRSQGNISAIQNALANPGSDNLKALSFSIMRRQMPNAGIFDMREEMQKGLGSPEYLKGMLGMVDRLGGDDQMKMSNLSGMFPGLSLSAIRRLFNNREGLASGAISLEELQSNFAVDFKGKAEENTTTIEKNTALVENGILVGQAVESMADAFKEAVRESMSEAVIELKNGQGTIRLGKIQQNTTKKPKGGSTDAMDIWKF